MSLTVTQCEVLAFARTPWTYPGLQESAIRDRFGWSSARYFQVLNHVLNLPDADRYDPRTVRRLRDRRDAMRAQRSSRRLG